MKLIGEGNIKKYLIYAFGEILLIVAGILIALQFSTLNENRKLDKKEISIYQEIRSDLLATQKDLIEDLNDLELELKSINIVRNMLVTKSDKIDTIRHHLPQLYNQKSFVPKTSAFESLKSAGLNILSNSTIRNAISNLYQLEFPYFLVTPAQIEHLKFHDKISVLLDKHLKIDTAMINADIADNRQMVWRRYFPYEIKNLEKMHNDEALIIEIQKSIDWRSARIRQHRLLSSKIDRLDEMISNELVKLAS